MRKIVLPILVALSTIQGAPTANAHCHPTQPGNPRCWGGAFSGNARIACFGCGVSNGTASLQFLPLLASATATYTVNEPVGATCVITGSASGTVTGAVNVSFNWTRVGATAVITTTGDVNGAGVAGFVVTSPVGNPCGGAVTAQVAGVVTGA